ncbi:helix-turn-helix domain-containing protein [Brevibacterium sp. UCMA 11754]|uniref:helix-turn-helix domain-containing protein n=1 Tax=Brevibacterium sp. UCMA 11754 TaxID=2749198 RepID=UPI002E1C6715
MGRGRWALVGSVRNLRGSSPQEAIQQSLAGVGARLRNLRREQGHALEEVADLVGMSLSTLSRLESGKRKPSLELLLLFGEHLRAATR